MQNVIILIFGKTNIRINSYELNWDCESLLGDNRNNLEQEMEVSRVTGEVGLVKFLVHC